MGIALDHPRRAADPHTLGQTREDVPDALHRGALAVQERAMGCRAIAVAGDALQLAPGLAARMPMRAEVAMSEPVMLDAIVLRTAMRRSVAGARASSGAGEHRRGCARRLGWCIGA